MTNEVAGVFAQVIPVLMIAIYLSDFRGLRKTRVWIRFLIFFTIVLTALVEMYLLLGITVGIEMFRTDWSFAAVGVTAIHLSALVVIAATNLFRNDHPDDARK